MYTKIHILIINRRRLAMALPRGGGGREKREKEKKLIVYRYMCLRVYLYAI